MVATYCVLIEGDEDDSLVAFRDAVFTYAACNFYRGRLLVRASARASEFLRWLGIRDFSSWSDAEKDVVGLGYADCSRNFFESSSISRLPIADGSHLPEVSLRSLRREGYLAETLFAALVYSSYGPDSLTYFPTRSELGLYFEESSLQKAPARWSNDYLDACQAFFMEELTPDELIDKSLAYLAYAGEPAVISSLKLWRNELRAVAFLVSVGLKRLDLLSQLCSALLTARWPSGAKSIPKMSDDDWSIEEWIRLWETFPREDRSLISERFCPGFEDLTESIFFALGPKFIDWCSSRDKVLS